MATRVFGSIAGRQTGRRQRLTGRQAETGKQAAETGRQAAETGLTFTTRQESKGE